MTQSPNVRFLTEANAPELIRDTIGAALVGVNVTITVNDSGDMITITAPTPYTDEQVRDVIGTAIVQGSGVTVAVNDSADTITIGLDSATQTKLANLSGVNSGDETGAGIKIKLGVSTLSGSNTGDQTIPTALPPTAGSVQTSSIASGGLAPSAITGIAATLTGPGTTVPRSQLPNISGSFWQTVANQAAMTALTAPDADTLLVVFRTDTPGYIWYLNPGLNPATFTNWQNAQEDAAGAAAAVQTNLTAEVTRATAAEGTNAAAITSEATTARAAELAAQSTANAAVGLAIVLGA